ncbi:zinc finger, CCHC-type containing protein [Tanacetum coccineum]
MAPAMKHMASNFAKLEKFKGVDFQRWQKKMHFLLSSMSVVYMLTTQMPEDGGENPTVEQVRKRAKWDNDDYVCRGLILNGMSDSLFDIYQNVETSKDLWDTLKAKYMAKDASSKKFLVSCIIDKLPPSWKNFKHTLKHLKDELTLVELGNHLRIKEFLRAQDNDKPKGNNVAGPSVVNMVEHNNSFKYNDNKGKCKHHDTKADPNKKPKVTYWKCGKPGHLKNDCKAGNIGNKANGSGIKGSWDGSSNSLKGIEATDQLTAAELCLEGQSLSWYRWSDGRTPFRSWENFKRRLLDRFQQSQEGILLCQLVGVPETILEGTFIKGLKQDLRAAVRVLNPEGLSHAMKLAVSIEKKASLNMSVVYMLTTQIPEDGGENPTVEQVRKRAKWDNDDYVCRGLILNGMSDSLFDIYQNVETSKDLWDTLEAKYMAKDASSKKFIVSCIIDKLPPSWKDFKHTLKHLKEELTLVELGSHLRIEESLRAQDNDKPKGNNVVGPSVVNMVEHNNSSKYNDNKGKCKHHDTKADPNKKPKVTYWKCGKPRHLKKDCKAGNISNKANGSGIKGSWDGSSNSLKGATVHVCKDRCWFKTYESLNDGSILHMGNESTALVHGHGCVDLRFSSGKVVSLLNVLHVSNIRKNLVSCSVLNNYGYKQVIESNKFVLSKHGVFIGFGYLSNHMFRLNIVSDNIGSAFMSTSKLNDSILRHARLGHVHFKRMQDMYKDGLIPAFDINTEKCKTCMLTKITKKPFQNIKRETEVLELIHSDLCDLHATPSLGNKKYFVTFIDDASRFCYVYLLHTKDEALDKFKVFKTKVKLQQGSLIKRFRTDRGGEYMDTLYFQSIGIIHETTALYTPQQNGISERKNRVLKEMVNSMLSYLGLSQGFWGEAMLTACYLLNRVPNKRNMITPYEPWTKKKPNLNYLRVWGCRAVVRLPDLKLKTLGERGIECIFVRYAEHSKAFRFYVIEPNDSVLINSIIESRDAIFDDNRFSSVPRPSQRSLKDGTEEFGGSMVLEKVTDEDDPKTFDEAMKSEDVAFWKEAINDEMDSIMGNNTWVLADLPLGCKWIFKRKLKVDGTVEKFKARLVIQGFKQKSWIDYFDIYAPFSMKDMGEADVIPGIRIKHESNGIVISQSHYIEKALKKFNYFDSTPVSTPMDKSEKLMPNNGILVILIKKTMDYRLMYTGYPSVLEGYTDASWISNTEDNSSSSGWVFLLGSGAISWASKKQACITGSTMEFKFVALAAAGKEAEWLKNLLLEIPLWVKPMAPISIRCDSAATLAKAYSQMYNGKSRHLGFRHSIIRELITNRVVSIEFVRSQQNLADHLTKGLARDLVIKSAERMGLKMCLEHADKEDEFVNFLMVNFFEKVLSKSMNKEEPPMYSNGLKGSILRTP